MHLALAGTCCHCYCYQGLSLLFSGLSLLLSGLSILLSLLSGAGKLQRLEEERLMHVEQLGAQDDTLADMDRQSHALQSQLDNAQTQISEVSLSWPER